MRINEAKFSPAFLRDMARGTRNYQTLRKLAKSGDLNVSAAVLYNPEADSLNADDLDNLAKTSLIGQPGIGSTQVGWKVAGHLNVRDDTLLRLTKHRDPIVSLRAKERLQIRAAREKRERVDEANFSTKFLIDMAKETKNLAVLRRICAHPLDYDTKVHRAVIENPNAPSDVVTKYGESGDDLWPWLAAKHPNATVDVLTRLTRHPSFGVARRAWDNLRSKGKIRKGKIVEQGTRWERCGLCLKDVPAPAFTSGPEHSEGCVRFKKPMRRVKTIRASKPEIRLKDIRHEETTMRADKLIHNALLTEDIVPVLKKRYPKLSTAHDANARIKDSAAIIDHIANTMDPTPNKGYTPRLVHWYNKGHLRQEDSVVMRAALDTFSRHKGKLERKDINQYEKPGDLHRALATLKAPEEAPASQRKQARIEGTDVLHDSPELHVAEIKTMGAMRECGRGSTWCVYADTSGDTFNQYTKDGPLIYIHDKAKNEKHLLHFATGQLHNVHNEESNIEDLAKRHPVLTKLFHGQNYNLFTDKERAEAEFLAGED